jgi:hypothetical protein
MVGVINPATGQSIDTQKSAAINADYQLVPGQPFPAEGSSPNSQPISTPATPPKNSKSRKKVSGGAIAGIVVGIILVALITAALVFVVRRARQRKAPKNLKDDAMSLTEGGDVEETVPVAMEFEPATPRVQSLVSPLSPPPQRKMSLLQTFYKYPFAEKSLVPPQDRHPAFRTDPTQDNTIERERERDFSSRFSR